MLSAKDVAEYFLTCVDENAGEGITNLKIQKLVYYAQGVYLAIYGTPLFQESIEAWKHGPVVPSLYHEYKCFGDNAIPVPSKIDNRKYSEKVKDVLDEVYNVFGQFSAWKLRNMTHEERPWKETPAAGIISNNLMREYFQTIVNNE